MLQLGLRRFDELAEVIERRGAARGLLVARVAIALLFGRETMSGAAWRARGIDTARGLHVTVGAREADGRWPAGLALAAADPAALRRWLAAEEVATEERDGHVLAGVPALAAAAAEALASGSLWPDDSFLARLDARLDVGTLSAEIRRSGELAARATVPGAGELDALAGTLDTPVVKTSRVAGIVAKDHVLVARSETCVRALLPGALIMTAAREVRPLAAAETRARLAAVLAPIPWPSLWHSRALRRVLRIT